MDDAELVRQVIQGNIGAFAELVYRYTAQIAAVCRAHVCRPDAVEDLVQETFARGLDRIADLREPARFGFWLYAIARNLCRDWLGDPHHTQQVLDAAVHAVARDSGGEDAPSRIDDLKACIRRLPVDLREVIEVYYSGGRATYQELADRLGVSFGQVDKMLTRARKLLRNCLEREGDGPPFMV
jgi:RNA polymerase sigma-70 factor (ECF subfamily)